MRRVVEAPTQSVDQTSIAYFWPGPASSDCVAVAASRKTRAGERSFADRDRGRCLLLNDSEAGSERFAATSVGFLCTCPRCRRKPARPSLTACHTALLKLRSHRQDPRIAVHISHHYSPAANPHTSPPTTRLAATEVPGRQPAHGHVGPSYSLTPHAPCAE